jgi:outer membrane protein/adhesin transport system outer membrane protein
MRVLKFHVPIFLVGFAFVCGEADAQSIEDALAAAYTQSTQLGAQRASQRATDELVPQALSNWRPTVTANGSVARTNTQYAPAAINQLESAGWGTTKTVGVQVVENVYRGGRTVAQTSQATNTVKAGQAQLKSTEESVLLSAAQSYLDVVRDEATVDLNASNEDVLKKELDASNARFKVGEVTRTDVALAEASYQQARAQYQTAVGQLATDRATYQRIIGQPPGKIEQPLFKYVLPPSLEEAVADAEVNNPAVIAAEYTERAARDNVDLYEGARLPTVSIVGSYTRIYPAPNSATAGLSSVGAVTQAGTIAHYNNGSIEAEMTWPLYTGGLASSQVRQSKQTANQALIAIEDAKRVARQNAITAWQQLTTARANIEALSAQVKAAEVGAEGTRQQALVGTSTVLDSLTAEQELLQAQVNLVGAQHDALLYSFTLLSAVGKMTAPDLGLAVAVYNPQTNQDDVRDRWMGTGVN